MIAELSMDAIIDAVKTAEKRMAGQRVTAETAAKLTRLAYDDLSACVIRDLFPQELAALLGAVIGILPAGPLT